MFKGIGAIIIFLSTSQVYCEENVDLVRVRTLLQQKKICEAAKITSQCLSSSTVIRNLDDCLTLGDEIAQSCLFDLWETKLEYLSRNGKRPQAEAILISKMKELKLKINQKHVLGETKVYRYSGDYALKHFAIFKQSPNREKILISLITDVWSNSEKWEEYTQIFLSEFPNSKSRTFVECLIAEDNFNRWAFEKVDYGAGFRVPRTVFNTSDSEKYKTRALELFTKVKKTRLTFQDLMPPCDVQYIDRALKSLNKAEFDGDVTFFQFD